jgi:malonate transporter and related proteins
MAAGVNTYVFASMYSVALRLATSTEMVGTAASIVTILAGWLVVLS